MISFLLEEGVLTVGTLSGLFTTALLNSLKANIVDPTIENVFPSHHLEPTTPPPPQPPPAPPPQLKPQTNAVNQTKSGFGDMFPIPYGPPPPQTGKNVIRWKTFLKDFITWLVIMFCLYIFWKKIIHPLKNNR